MRPFRLSALALGALLVTATAGCRTAGVGNLARTEPVLPRPTATAADLLSEHNENARRVVSLEARPSVSGSNRSRLIPGAGARLAMERPRNFRFQVSSPMQEVADIGSNNDEFWLWFKDAPEHAVFYANYEDDGNAPPAVGLQPDWLIDALTLRPVPDDELARMKVTPGTEPGTVVLSVSLAPTSGVPYVKELVLSDSTHRIRELRVYSADRKTLLAKSVITGYDEYAVPAREGEPTEKVALPRKVRLELSQEKLALDVTMKDVKVNPTLDANRRTALFTEPKPEGFARRNLAESFAAASVGVNPAAAASRPARGNGRTTVRETLPAPAPRVRLVEPAPLGQRPPTNPDDPGQVAINLPPARARGVQEVIGPSIPTVSDPAPEFIQAHSGWRNSSLSAAVER